QPDSVTSHRERLFEGRTHLRIVINDKDVCHGLSAGERQEVSAHHFFLRKAICSVKTGPHFSDFVVSDKAGRDWPATWAESRLAVSLFEGAGPRSLSAARVRPVMASRV